MIIASGSPLTVLNSMMRPQYVPGSTQYFSSVQLPEASSGHETTSDFMRIANTPKSRLAPSIVPQR